MGTPDGDAPAEVDWNRCTCAKVYRNGDVGPMEGIVTDVDPTPVITKINPDCPELGKLGHPKR